MLIMDIFITLLQPVKVRLISIINIKRHYKFIFGLFVVLTKSEKDLASLYKCDVGRNALPKCTGLEVSCKCKQVQVPRNCT